MPTRSATICPESAGRLAPKSRPPPDSVAVDRSRRLPDRRCKEQSMTLLGTVLLSGACAIACPPTSSVVEISPDSRTISLGAISERTGRADIVDTAVAAGSFNTLAAALTAAGLVDALKGDGPFTVFAPTDEAFAKLPKETLESLLKPENKDRLVAILTYHVVDGRVPAERVVTLKHADTLNGQRVEIAASGGVVKVNDATVVKTDVMASNGVIHVIDRVIIPTDKNVVQVAQEGGFSTLAAAIEAAGLVDALSGKGPFTVFAPTDSAFAKLPAGTVESLLKPENRAQLVEILTYHVVAGRVFSDQAVKLTSAKSLLGKDLSLRVDAGTLRIEGARVTSADIQASNGVIHVIDTVIIPN